MSDPTLSGPSEPHQPPPGRGYPPPSPPAPHYAAAGQPTAPAQPGGPIPPAPPARKGLSGWAIAGIVVGALVLLCCGIGSVVLVASSGEEDARRAQASPAPSERADSTEADEAAPAADEESADDEAGDDTFDMPAGSTLIVESAEGTIKVTVESFETRETACDEYGLPPDHGMYLIADVTVEITEGTGSINPLYFTWVADDGTTGDSISGAFAGCGQALDSGNDMRTGSLRSGTVVFDVADAEGALEYESGWFGGADGSWRP